MFPHFTSPFSKDTAGEPEGYRQSRQILNVVPCISIVSKSQGRNKDRESETEKERQKDSFIYSASFSYFGPYHHVSIQTGL